MGGFLTFSPAADAVRKKFPPPSLLGTPFSAIIKSLPKASHLSEKEKTMNQEDIIIHLTANEHEISALRHRVGKMEGQVDAINKLTVSVNTLAGSVRDLLEVQKSQNDRLCRLELRPAKEARDTRREVIRALISTLTGALMGTLITALLHA
jgi:hypothetical protein